MGEEQQHNIATHGEDGCGYCLGKPAAIARQREMEEKWDNGFGGKFDAGVELVTQKGEELFMRLHELSKPLGPLRLVEAAERTSDRFNNFLMERREAAERINSRSSTEIHISLRKATAAATAAGALLAPVANHAPAAAQPHAPIVRVMPEFDPEISISIAENIARDPLLNEKFTPFVDGDQGNAVRLVSAETEQAVERVSLEQETVSADPSYKVDISNVKSVEREALAKAMNITLAADQSVAEIEQPLVRYLKPGQNPTDLARSLLGAELAKSKAAVYQLTWVICDMNDIDVSKGEDRVILPSDEILLPYETSGLRGEILKEHRPTAVAEELQSNTQQQLEELIIAVKAVENPEPVFKELARDIVGDTPVSDRLEGSKDVIVKAIEEGEMNLEYVQSEAIIDLALEHSGVTIDSAARQLVSHAFNEAGIEPVGDELNEQAEELLIGIRTDSPIIKALELSGDDKIDVESKPLGELTGELQEEIDAAAEQLAEGAQVLGSLGLSHFDVSESARELVNAQRSESLRGDQYYYLALHGLSAEEKVQFVRSELPGAIYEDHAATALLEETERKIEIIQNTADLLSEDHIALGEYISEATIDLEAQISEARGRVIPVVAEVSALFEEANEIDEAVLNEIVIDSVKGESSDYVRMRLLEEVAKAREAPTRTVVDSYFNKAFSFAGVDGVVSQYQLSELVEHVMLYWESDTLGKSNVQLDAQKVVEAMYEGALADLINTSEQYLDEELNVEQTEEQALRSLLLEYMIREKDDSYYQFHFISQLSEGNDLLTQYLFDYYESQDAGYYLHEDKIVEALANKLIDNKELSPAQFTEALSMYNTGNPEEIFPEGRQYILREYSDADLSDFLNEVGLDIETILTHPLNEHITKSEEGVIASYATIWFEDSSAIDEGKFKQAYDELVLGIAPPQPIDLAPEPAKDTAPQAEVTPETSSSNSIVRSLENVKYQDKINNLDNATKAIVDWYESFDDPDRDPAMPDGYVRMPSHEFFDDLDVLFTWAEKTANSEEYASPVTIAGSLAIAELYQQMIAEYPQYAGSMVRFRDLNSAHHSTHDDGRHLDISTHMNAEVSQASTGPLMDYISGDGTENDYNFALNVEFAVKLAGLQYEGKPAISRILSSDDELVEEVNNRLGFKFMSDVNYHHEHWHINFDKKYALDEYRPQSSFEDLGYKGDLGIGGEYKEPTPEMKEEEHGEFEEAIDEAVEKVEKAEVEEAARIEAEKKAAEEAARAEEERKAAEAEEQRRIAEEKQKAEAEREKKEKEEASRGVTTEQQVVSQADSVEKLVALGYFSLTKIPKADQDKLNEVLSDIPSIEYAIDNYNSRQGDPRGPNIPATAVLAMAYDLGMRGDDLLDTVTTLRGESIGFSPFIIGDDKGARTDDGEVVRFSTGLGQFYQFKEDGFTDAQMERAEDLLHPAAAMVEVVKYKERRGLTPWNVWNNREEEKDNWNAHRAKVLGAVQILEDSGFDIIP